MLSVTDIFNMLIEFTKTSHDRTKKHKFNMVRIGTLVKIKVSVPFLMLNKSNYIRQPPISYILI